MEKVEAGVGARPTIGRARVRQRPTHRGTRHRGSGRLKKEVNKFLAELGKEIWGEDFEMGE